MKTKVNQMMLAAFLMGIMLAGNANATGKESILVSELENTKEIRLELENWMVNDMYWLRSGIHTDQETEMITQMQIQEEAYWQEKLQELVVEKEDQMVIEPWMMNEYFWNGKNVKKSTGV